MRPPRRNGISERAICLAWSSAPARGGSKTSPSKLASSLKDSGRRNRSRRSPVTRFSPAACRNARSNAASAAASPSTACTSARARQPQRERAAAGEQVGDLPGARKMGADQCGHGAVRRLSVACRKPPGGTATATPSNITIGCFGSTTISPSTASRAKPCVMTKCVASAARFLRQRAALARGKVEAGGGRGDRDAEGARRRGDQRGELPDRVQRGHDLRQQDRAFLDRDDLAGKLPVVAEQHAGIGPARRKYRPSPRVRLAGDKLADRRLDAAAGQGADHDVALPGAVGAGLEMLDGAAAAGSESAGTAARRAAATVWPPKPARRDRVRRRRSPPRRAARTARTPDRARCRRRRRPVRRAARW